jgi:hypothetical protein
MDDFKAETDRINAYYNGFLAGLQSALCNKPLEIAKREIESRRAEAIFALKEKYDKK